MKKLLIPYAVLVVLVVFNACFVFAIFYGLFFYHKGGKNSDLVNCVSQTQGTDADCEWCEMICSPKQRQIISVRLKTNYSITFREKTKSGITDTFVLDNLTEKEYILFIKNSKSN